MPVPRGLEGALLSERSGKRHYSRRSDHNQGDVHRPTSGLLSLCQQVSALILIKIVTLAIFQCGWDARIHKWVKVSREGCQCSSG